MKYGKRIVLIFMLFIPQDIFAIDLYGSLEGREALLQHHKINIADAFENNQINPTLNFNSNFGYKAGLGFGFGKIFDIKMFYSQLSDNNQKHEGFFENTYPLSGTYIKELNINNIEYNESSGLENGTGSANGKFELEEIDLEFGITFRFDPGIYYRFIIGGRYGKYKQEMWVNRWDECFSKNPNEHPKCDRTNEPFGSERYLNQKIDGFGPRFGLSVIAPLKKTNLNLVASASYSILYAKKDLYDNFSQTTHPKGDQIFKDNGDSFNPRKFEPSKKKTSHIESFSIASAQEDVVVRYMNIEGGLQYEIKLFKSGVIFLTGGYKYSVHYGVLNTYGKILKDFKVIPDDTRKNIVAHSFGNKTEDLVSHGPFLRIGFKF